MTETTEQKSSVDLAGRAKNDLLCCPRCGGEDGCHYKMIERRTLYYDWRGRPNGGSEPDIIRGGTKLYCNHCDLDVTNIVTLD